MEFIGHWNGRDQFEIEGCYGDKFRVNLGEKICSCRRWQLSGIPYAHSIYAMYFMGYTPEDFVDEVYHKKAYMRVYSHLKELNVGQNQEEFLSSLQRSKRCQEDQNYN